MIPGVVKQFTRGFIFVLSPGPAIALKRQNGLKPVSDVYDSVSVCLVVWISSLVFGYRRLKTLSNFIFILKENNSRPPV